MKQNKLFIWAWLLTCVLWTGCDDSVTVRVSCEEQNATLCVNNKVYICIDHTWQNPQDCVAGCDDAKKTCLEKCKESQERCSDDKNNIEVCQSDGTWQSHPCGEGQKCDIENVKCEPESDDVECTEENYQCTGTILQVCKSGNWETSKECNEGEICDEDSQSCMKKPVENKCSEEGKIQCRNEGDSHYMMCKGGIWTPEECPEDEACFGDDCRKKCEYNEVNSVCQGVDKIEVCRQEGYWDELQKCEAEKQCIENDVDGKKVARCVEKCDPNKVFLQCAKNISIGDENIEMLEVCYNDRLHLFGEKCMHGCDDEKMKCRECKQGGGCFIYDTLSMSKEKGYYAFCKDGYWSYSVCDQDGVSCDEYKNECTCVSGQKICAVDKNGTDVMLMCENERWRSVYCPQSEKGDGCDGGRNKCVSIGDTAVWGECSLDDVYGYYGKDNKNYYKKCNTQGMWKEIETCEGDNCDKVTYNECVSGNSYCAKDGTILSCNGGKLQVDEKCEACSEYNDNDKVKAKCEGCKNGVFGCEDNKLSRCEHGDWVEMDECEDDLVCNSEIGVCHKMIERNSCAANGGIAYALLLDKNSDQKQIIQCENKCYVYDDNQSAVACDKDSLGNYASLDGDGVWRVKHPYAIEITCPSEVITTDWYRCSFFNENFKCIEGRYQCGQDNSVELCVGESWRSEYQNVGTCPKGTRCDDSGNFIRCVPND